MADRIGFPGSDRSIVPPALFRATATGTAVWLCPRFYQQPRNRLCVWLCPIFSLSLTPLIDPPFNELYEDLTIVIAKDVFSPTKTSILASQRAVRFNGRSQRPETARMNPRMLEHDPLREPQRVCQ